MILTKQEIKPGLAVFLDPEILIKRGALSSVVDKRRTYGQHLFQCVSRKPVLTFWVVLHSHMSGRRMVLPSTGRMGHPNWVNSTHYFHPNQIWVASPVAVVEASYAEQSSSNMRNSIDVNLIPNMWLR